MTTSRLGIRVVMAVAAIAAAVGNAGCTSATARSASLRAAPHRAVIGRSARSARVRRRRPGHPLPAGAHPTPGGGELLVTSIPGRLSGFVARRAVVYLPPAARQPSPPAEPVLELLHGTPDYVSDWVVRGGLVATLDAFAAAHSGRAPIVVMPDINGSFGGDTECVRAGGASVERYLTVDVPDYLTSHIAGSDNQNWWIAGNSEGGTCAMMLALRHSDVYGAFGDLSGLSRPTLGVTDQPGRTIRELFHGSRADYNQHDPAWLLQHHRYPAMSGWWGCGTDETSIQRNQEQISQLARRAGISVQTNLIPGGHGWPTWTLSLREMLPWLWQQAGGQP